jgi:hypothetical protein
MNTAEHYACNYAVLCFCPYPETGEFVNLGVVVHCASAGLLASRIETAKHKRVTDFFPELDVTQFRFARDAMMAEIRRVERLNTRPTLGQRVDRETGRALFLELVRPREAVFRFGEIRTLLTADPAAVAEELFERYVERQFAQPKEYQETVMARRYFEALKLQRPGRDFVRDRNVGTDGYRVRLPICSKEADEMGVPRRALKPLDLDRVDPSMVIDHGDAWIGRIRRLKEIRRLPERLVVAVRTAESGLPGEAAHDIVEKLRREDVLVGDAADTERIVALTAD